MKIFNNFSKIVLSVILVISIFSCSKNDTTDTTSTKSILAMAQNQPNLTTFVQALQITGLDTTLSSGSFTVFAPTNDAFTSYFSTIQYPGAVYYPNVSAVPVAILKNLLLNHVLTGSFKGTDLTTNSYFKTNAFGAQSTTNNLNALITNIGNVIKINNNATIIVPNLTTDTGVLHIVDKVIGLPRITDLVGANTNFSTLVSLLNRPTVIPVQPNFLTVLGGTGPFTLFAPTNDAFTVLNTELLPGGTSAVTPANITKVLYYHVVSGNILSNTLTQGQVVTTLLTPAPNTFTVNVTIGVKLFDLHSPQRAASVIATDIQANNGVIHILDKVLLPF